MSKQNKQRSHWFLALGLALILALGLAGTALAVEFRGDDTVTIGQDEVIDDDLVVSGATVVVDGVINGDLVAAGDHVIVNGKVNGSLMMAGRTLEFNGQVGGTVYSAGAALTVGPNAMLARSLFFAGYSYSAAPGSVIGRDTIVTGYQAMLQGTVKRHLFASVGALELDGAIGGDVNANVAAPGTPAPPIWTFWPGAELPPSINPGLRIGSDAQIAGQLRYSSAVEQTGTIRTEPAGGVVYSMPPAATTDVAAAPTPRTQTLEWLWARLREFVSLVFAGGLALWWLPTRFTQVAERTQGQPWVAGAWGLLVGMVGFAGALLTALLITLLVAGLAALTLGGLATSAFGLGFSGLGLAFTIFLLLGAYGSKLVVVYPLSQRLFERFAPPMNQYKMVPLVLGVLVFVLLRSIPYLGVLVEIGVTVVGLGAMWLAFRDRSPKAAAPKLVLTPA
jgi:hypothetical protein